MEFEEYWKQTRKKWERRVVDPYVPLGTVPCGFCLFGLGCIDCPVTEVYGGNCRTVKPVQAYCDQRQLAYKTAEELSALAEAVVQELDDRKAELIAAMYELRKKELREVIGSPELQRGFFDYDDDPF